MSEENIKEALAGIIHPETKKGILESGTLKEIIVNNSGVKLVFYSQKVKDPVLMAVINACIKTIHQTFGKDIKVEWSVKQPEKTPIPTKKGEIKGVKYTIAISSGKGGVGKSTVSANLAVTLAKKGYRVGLIDADIFGPSVPKMFGLEDYSPEVIREGEETRIIPAEKYGIKILSIGFFVKPEDATIWRGPMASGALKQLIFETKWDDLDYLLFDMPPGTSDIQITLVNELSLSGAVIVSTPQKVALADAVKGIAMFRNKNVNVPILGLIENMAWFTPKELPENKYYIFGQDGCVNLAKENNLPLLGQVPIISGIMDGAEEGIPASLDQDSEVASIYMSIAEKLEKQLRISAVLS